MKIFYFLILDGDQFQHLAASGEIVLHNRQPYLKSRSKLSHEAIWSKKNLVTRRLSNAFSCATGVAIKFSKCRAEYCMEGLPSDIEARKNGNGHRKR